MRSLVSSSLCLLLPLAACSGGSNGGAAVAPGTTGSVYVVVDTSTGSDTLVQFQVAAAVLERGDGTATANGLRAAELVTFADPTGEVDGFVLHDVPTGNYESLHLMLVPGGGAASFANGEVRTATSAIDVAVPIADGLQHSAQGRSWLVLGHNGAAPPAAPAAGAGVVVWTPTLTARADGSQQQLEGLRVALVQAPTVTAQLAAADDGLLTVGFAAGCTFDDDEGGTYGRSDDFLARLGGEDDLRVSGELRRDGRILARSAHRGRGNDGPRLLGRITDLRPLDSTFLMDVRAEVRRGGERRLLDPPVSVLVLAAEARIHRPDDRAALTFADLQVGNLAKVEWTRRGPGPGGVEQVLAREIEVTSQARPMRPEWQGLVQSVDLTSDSLVVVPRGDDPIVIEGVAVLQATLHVDGNTILERRERNGPGRITIGLGDIVPGADRIWWRGTVTGPASIDATWIRVREE